MKQKQIREDIVFVKEQVRELLIQRSEEAYLALGNVMDMEYVRFLAEGDTELSILGLLVRIHRMEQTEKMGRTLLQTGETLEELLVVYYKILFYLQRIWFCVEEEYQKTLIAYMREKQISPYAVYMILEESRISDKKQVWEQVMKLWEKQYG